VAVNTEGDGDGVSSIVVWWEQHTAAVGDFFMQPRRGDATPLPSLGRIQVGTAPLYQKVTIHGFWVRFTDPS